ncbi:hypothetical protein BDW22DRAFT_251332 [Trametopsis cervina]|nr:hypothetical protein BDW22DRAFT_251332 [Trametopsis cervina]
MSQQIPRTVARAIRAARETDVARHVHLRNVPKTVLPNDLWRLCARAEIENVESVDIDYENLEPTGSAWITLTASDFVPNVIRKFHTGIYLGASRVTASSEPLKAARLLSRSRGERGREQAAARGVIGSGPSAGVTGGARNVCLSGFPATMPVEAIKTYLKSFKLAGTVPGEKEVLKLEPASKEVFNTSARFLVRLASSSEAHRLVRKLHETDYDEVARERKWRIKAHIVY